MKKQITDELIEEILNKTKFNEQDSHDEDHIKKVVLDHYDSEITDDWNVSCDFFIYEETTADGYSVYVATYDQRSISVSEHVHYYDNNLGDELRQAICEGIKIYIEPSGMVGNRLGYPTSVLRCGAFLAGPLFFFFNMPLLKKMPFWMFLFDNFWH